MNALLLLVFLVAVLVVWTLREPPPATPEPVLKARAAATTGRLGDVAVIHLSRGSNRDSAVRCSCPDAEVLYTGSLDDCRMFAHAYNDEVRRLWEGAMHDD